MRNLKSGFLLVLVLLTALASRADIGVALQMPLGNPSNAGTDTTNHDHFLIQRAQYALDYSDKNGEPNWVSWDLTAADIGSSGRSSFIPDPTLPTGFYAVQPSDYTNSGYDRGHMCPSADRTVTTADNQILFYMSNILPQAPDNNQGVWANFESYCRTLANSGYEVLITCGPSGFAGSRIPTGVAAIPGYVWKIAVVVPGGASPVLSRIDTSTRVIAIKIPNVAGVRNDPWQKYVTSAAQIEADTGFTFFTALTPTIANALRVKVDGQTATGAPNVVSQPVSQTTAVGGSATFTVTATGDTPLTYQWLKDDIELPGATDATLSLINVQASDAGSYDVIVTNGVGSATSNAAALIITGLPPTVTTPPAAQTVSAGANATFAVVAGGSPPFTYQWRKNTVSLASATSTTLTLANVQSADAASYDVIITNSVGSVTSSAATLTVNPAAPTITVQPVSRTVTGGTTAVFSVTATGTAPLTYQWRKNGSALTNGGVVSGATTATLTLTGVTSSDAGNYDVVVNGLGSVTSSVAVLTVNAATILWDFTTASPTSGLPTDITGGTVTQNNNNGTTTMLTNSSVSSGYSGASGGNNAGAATKNGALNKATSTYFEFTLTPASSKKLQITGMSFGTRSTGTGPIAYDVYTSFDNFTTAVATGAISNNSAWSLKTPSFATVTGTLNAPITVRIYGYNGSGAVVNTAVWRIDDLKLNVNTLTATAPVAPAVTGNTPANGSNGVAVSSPITVTFNEPVNVGNGWFAISSAANGPVAATVTGGPMAFTLTPPASFSFGDTVSVKVFATQITDKDTGTLTLPADYLFSFNTGLPTPPSILAQPQSQTVADGGTATFTVSAGGTAPLTYQWRKGGVAISGNASATTPTLTLAGVTPASAGSYDVVVSNTAGSVTSSAASLSVTLVAPMITTQPASKIVTAGSATTFTVAATGTTPLTYQWRKGGVPLTNGGSISGATAATLTLTGIVAASAGQYDVVVSNVVGSTPSAAAALGVTATGLSTVTWDFTTADPTSGLPADLTGGTVAQGNNNGSTTLLASTSASSGYSGASGGNNAGAAARTGSLSSGAGGSAYFEFTLTPNAGKQLVATGLTFASRSTSTGPQAFALYSSTDNFSAVIATGTFTNDSVWRLSSPAFAGVRGAPGAAVTFRLFGYNGTGSPGSGTANWRIDDMKLTVGVELPPAVIATSPGAGGSAVPISSGIAVTFNQPVVVAGSWFSVTSAANGAVAANVTGGPTTFTFTPSANFSYSDLITVSLFATNVSDQTGTLSLPSNYAFSFTTAAPVPPSFSSQPVPQTVTAFGAASFSVTATGTAPLSYQWRKGGIAISGNASATTSTLTLSGVTTADADTYDCIVTNIGGTATSNAATLSVNKAPANVALGTLTFTYDGSAKATTATTIPGGLSIALTYDGSTAAPANAGSYAVVATIVDANYAGSATGTLAIAPAAQSISFGPLASVTYGASPVTLSATATSGLPVSFSILSGPATLSGSVVTITGAGTVVVRAAQPGNANYNPAANIDQSLVVSKAPQTITFAALADKTYGATPFVVSASSDSGLPVTFSLVSGPATVSDGTVSITGAGTVILRAAQAGDPNFNPAPNVDRAFAVAKATLTVTAQSATRVYGADNPSFTLAYNGFVGSDTAAGLDAAPTASTTATAASDVGTYPITASGGADHNYAFAYVNGTLAITPATQAITFGPLPSRTFGDASFSVSATSSSSLPVTLSVVSGPATVTGTTVTLTGAGSVTLRASQSGSVNYSVAAPIEQSFNVAKAAASITFTTLSQVYTGAPMSASATTTPAGLGLQFSYNGSATAPTAVGAYALDATILDANYAGTASAIFTITKAAGTVTLGDLNQTYDGTPKSVTASTNPSGLAVALTYDGSAAAPTAPGSYAVVATITDSTYSGSATGTLVISTTALVRHAPSLSGGLAGPLQLLLSESTSLNGGAYISGDLLVPGTPTVQLNGHPTYAGMTDGTGSVSPSNYTISLSGNAVLRRVVRRTDAIAMPTISAPPTPTGTRNVSLNSANDSAGDFATVRDLALNGNAGTRTVPAGTYGAITVSGNSSLVLGIAGATTPAVYNVQSLTLSGNGTLQVVGPVVINLATGGSVNGATGDPSHPEWLRLNIAAGGLVLNGSATLSGFVTAPSGTITINGNTTLKGQIISDRLTINGDGLLSDPSQ